MKTEEIIIDRIHQLPEYMHIQVIDYIEFLLTKYSETEENQKQPEIPDEHKNLLQERLDKYENNEIVGDSWENVKQRLMNKYAI